MAKQHKQNGVVDFTVSVISSDRPKSRRFKDIKLVIVQPAVAPRLDTGILR